MLPRPDEVTKTMGQFQVLKAADPVYRFLEFEGLEVKEMPPVNRLVSSRQRAVLGTEFSVAGRGLVPVPRHGKGRMMERVRKGTQTGGHGLLGPGFHLHVV